MKLQYKAHVESHPPEQPQVYFTGHPQDYDAFLEPTAREILDCQNCVIYYDSQPEAAWDEEKLFELLREMKLFVIPVTRRFLCEKNRALDVEFPFAIRNHIPVLPLMQEPGLETLFNQKCGNLQMLDRSGAVGDEKQLAGDVLPYEKKLEKRLSDILIGDEMAEKIRRLDDLHQSDGDDDKAGQYHQEMEASSESGVKLRDRLVMYGKRGDECRMQDDWEQAEVYYTKQLQLAERLYAELRTDESREDLAASYGQMAEVCWSTGRLAEAEAYTLKNRTVCQEWYEDGNSWYASFAIARTYYHMGTICHLKGNLQKAEENYLQALITHRQLYNQNPNRQVLRAIALDDMRLISLLVEQGRMKAAISCGYEMYNVAMEAESEEYMDCALKNLFCIAVDLGDQSQKLINSGRDEEALDVLGEMRELGKYLSDIGRTIYDNNGEAVTLRPMAAIIQYNLALAHSHLGNFEQSEQAAFRGGNLYEELFQEAGKRDYGESSAQCWEFLAIHYMKRHNSEKAVYYFRRALVMRKRLFEMTNDQAFLPAMAKDCIHLGKLLMEQQRWKEATDYFRQSSNFLLTHFKQTNDLGDVELNCQATMGLGDICWNLEDILGARKYYEDTFDRAAMLYEKSRTPLTLAECGKLYLRLGTVYSPEEDPQIVIKFYEKAYMYYKGAERETPSEENKDGLAQAAFTLGRLIRDAKLLKEAHDCCTLLCAQHPENESYSQRLRMVEKAMR